MTGLFILPFITNSFTIGEEDIFIKMPSAKANNFNFSSVEADSFINDGKVSNNLYNEAIRMSEGNQVLLFNLVSKGIETNHWIKFAIYYMTDPSASQISFADKDTREFVNGIAQLAGFGKIYDDSDIADIDLYDCVHLNSNYTGKFLLYKPDLIDFLSSPMFISAKNSRIFRMNNANDNIIDGRFIEIKDKVNTQENLKTDNAYINPAFAILNSFQDSDDDEIIKPSFIVNTSDLFGEKAESVEPSTTEQQPQEVVTPVKFNVPPEVLPKRSERVNAHAYTKFEAILSKFIPETIKHRYDYIDNIYYLFITRPDTGAEEYYILDDGSIMGGNSVSILANYINQNGNERAMFVDILAHPAITSKILQRVLFNYLTPDEVEDCWGDFLYDKTIYNNIDFHNTDFFDDFDVNTKNGFERSMLGVMKVMDMIGWKNVRMRFDNFNDFCHFTLTSDFYMYRPLPYIQDHVMEETFVLEGAKIIVDGIYIYAEYNGTSKRFKMG